MNWQTMGNAPKDGTYVMLYCPGVSAKTNGILQGYWDSAKSAWLLNPYATVVFTTLFPSMWAEMPPAPK